jgi:hypothetical protein
MEIYIPNVRKDESPASVTPEFRKPCVPLR